MVVSETHGELAPTGRALPVLATVAFLLEAANTHESQLARDVLAKVRVPRPGQGRPGTRILTLASDALELRRDLLRKRGIKSSISERKRRGKRRQRGPRPKLYDVSKRRYKVERVNAWLDNFRGPVVRYERRAAHYLSYCMLTAILFCLRRLLP